MNMPLMKDSTVRTHLDLSTAHVTQADMNLMADEAVANLDQDGPGAAVPVAVYPYGAILFVLHYHDEPEEREQHLEEVRQAGYSEAVVELIKLAWELDVDMIRLDRDAETRDDLATFEW
jgi:hypothetical protein